MTPCMHKAIPLSLLVAPGLCAMDSATHSSSDTPSAASGLDYTIDKTYQGIEPRIQTEIRKIYECDAFKKWTIETNPSPEKNICYHISSFLQQEVEFDTKLLVHTERIVRCSGGVETLKENDKCYALWDVDVNEWLPVTFLGNKLYSLYDVLFGKCEVRMRSGNHISAPNSTKDVSFSHLKPGDEVVFDTSDGIGCGTVFQDGEDLVNHIKYQYYDDDDGELVETTYDHETVERIILVLPAQECDMHYTMDKDCKDPYYVRSFCQQIWNNWEFKKWFSREFDSGKELHLYDAFSRFLNLVKSGEIQIHLELPTVTYHDDDLASVLRLCGKYQGPESATITKQLSIDDILEALSKK